VKVFSNNQIAELGKVSALTFGTGHGIEWEITRYVWRWGK